MAGHIDRILNFIGVVATVIGTGVAIYAFVAPNELSRLLQDVAARLAQREPVLDEAERVYIKHIDTAGWITLAKEVTTSSGVLAVIACHPVTLKEFSRRAFPVGREAWSTEFKISDWKELPVVVTAELGSEKFARAERWTRIGAGFQRASVPALRGTNLVGCELLASSPLILQ